MSKADQLFIKTCNTILDSGYSDLDQKVRIPGTLYAVGALCRCKDYSPCLE